MRSILIVIEVEKPGPQSLELGIYLAQLTGSPLIAIFIDNFNTTETMSEQFIYENVYVKNTSTLNLPAVLPNEQKLEKSVQLFEATCARRVAHHILSNASRTLDELIDETQFADILVASPAVYLSSPINQSSVFIKHLLRKSKCPLIFSPCQFKEIRELYFALDNRFASCFAIKQFTYLFPELRDKKLTILQINDKTIPENKDYEKIIRYLEPHYKEITFYKPADKPVDELFDCILTNRDAFMITDTYVHSNLSAFFKHNGIGSSMELNTLPLFITH